MNMCQFLLWTTIAVHDVCPYVCMCVCMYVCDVCMYICDVCMYVYMYVHTYVI